ncbi:MAG: nucleoside hydrolase [Candidatus Limnocylindrales bacterium]
MSTGGAASTGLICPNRGSPPPSWSATALMTQVLSSSRENVTVVATGPITNVAALFREHPEVIGKIEQIIFMGGSVDRGNHTPTAEFNTYADPEALAVVLASGLPIKMVGLNLTHQALATPTVVSRMKAMNHDIGRIAAGWMGFFGSSYRAIWEFDSPPVHDPCTVATLIQPDLITWRDCFVAVETTGEWTRGTTVVDLHGRYQQPANVQVAMTLDADRYWELVLASIDRLGRSR